MTTKLKFEQIENPTLSQELKKSILRFIAESVKVGIYKLPSEVSIAKDLGVSRIALREVFKEMRNEGILYSLHGKGTFINKNFTDLRFRLTPAREFLKSIIACGYKASVDVVHYEIEQVDLNIGETLGLDESDKVLNISKVFYADEKPVIFCVDTFPFKYFNDEEIDGEELIISSFDYFRKKTNIVVENDIVEMTAVLGDVLPSCFSKFKSEFLHKPLIEMDSVYYTKIQEPVMKVRAYFDSKYIKLSQLRKQDVYDDFNR